MLLQTPFRHGNISGVDRFAAYRSQKHFGSLDGLRALSILAVLWHHTAGTTAALPLLQHGFLGVDLFFVLSGFLIVTLLLRERESRGSIALGRFYARRALRIFPLYYGILAALVVLLGVVRPGASWAAPFFAKLPYYLTYTSNWLPDATLLAVTWSLATEEQFYLVWPPLEKYLRPCVLLMLLAGFIGLNQCLNFQLASAIWPAWLISARAELEILQITFTPICLGVGLAHLLHSPQGFGLVNRLVGHSLGQSIAVGLFLAVASFPADLSGSPRLLVHLALVGLLASCLVRNDHALSAVLNRPWLVRIGAVSYGMYLLHLFVVHGLQTVGRGSIPSGALFAACAVVTYVAAELSFRWLETPFLRWKDRYGGAPLCRTTNADVSRAVGEPA